MTPHPPSILNLEKLIELADNDQDFIKEILAMFVDNTPSDLLRIQTALNEKNYKIAGEIAHKLKPTFSLLGIVTGETALQQMEHNGLNDEETHTLQRLLDEVNKACQEAVVEIKLKYTNH